MSSLRREGPESDPTRSVEPESPQATDGAQRHPLQLQVRTSIVLVSYNSKTVILPCLKSVFTVIPPDCEVIVVDNASSDGSAETIRQAFPQVSVVQAITNGGFGSGCNLGARAARGNYLIFLNPDTTVDQGWINALVAPFQTNARTGLVTARILLADGSRRINVCGIDIHVTGLSLARGLGAPGDAFTHPEKIASVSGAAFAIRRDLFEALGGFDEDMFLYMEDADLSWRARLAGWTCQYAPGSVVLHHYSLKLVPGRIFYQERNRYMMLLKSLKWATLVMLLPAACVAELVTWGFVLMNRLPVAEKIAAYRWIITHWSVMMAKRRRTQSLRAVTDRELLLQTVGSLAFGQVASPVGAAVARLTFNSLFSILRWVTLGMVWW